MNIVLYSISIYVNMRPFIGYPDQVAGKGSIYNTRYLVHDFS